MSLSEDCLAAPGSIIAVIIDTHRARKDANEPSRVATPMSIPLISQTATPHHVAATPRHAHAPLLADAPSARPARPRLEPPPHPARWPSSPSSASLPPASCLRFASAASPPPSAPP